MANHGVMFGWNRPVGGREALAGELFKEAMTYWTTQIEKKNIESFEPALLARHGGDLNGFILIRGDREKILSMMDTDEYKMFMMRCDYVLEGFGMVQAVLGEELMKQMGMWQEMVASNR